MKSAVLERSPVDAADRKREAAETESDDLEPERASPKRFGRARWMDRGSDSPAYFNSAGFLPGGLRKELRREIRQKKQRGCSDPS